MPCSTLFNGSDVPVSSAPADHLAALQTGGLKLDFDDFFWSTGAFLAGCYSGCHQ